MLTTGADNVYRRIFIPHEEEYKRLKSASRFALAVIIVLTAVLSGGWFAFGVYLVYVDPPNALVLLLTLVFGPLVFSLLRLADEKISIGKYGLTRRGRIIDFYVKNVANPFLEVVYGIELVNKPDQMPTRHAENFRVNARRSSRGSSDLYSLHSDDSDIYVLETPLGKQRLYSVYAVINAKTPIFERIQDKDGIRVFGTGEEVLVIIEGRAEWLLKLTSNPHKQLLRICAKLNQINHIKKSL
jgi:hypothetical protein